MGLYDYVIVMAQGLGQEIISQNKQKGYSVVAGQVLISTKGLPLEQAHAELSTDQLGAFGSSMRSAK